MPRYVALCALACLAVLSPTTALAGRDLRSSDARDAAPGRSSQEDMPTAEDASVLAEQIARARVALAPFATSLPRARARGYTMQITPMMENMGFHFMNPQVTGFDVRRPPILVYVRTGRRAQLVAAEWVFPERPASPPLPGARYGSFAAACHYDDGTFIPQIDESACAPASPQTGARFTFWHPDLVTMHLWLWYPNPDGVFNSTNPLIAPFNER